jgi:hypothetical protein
MRKCIARKAPVIDKLSQAMQGFGIYLQMLKHFDKEEAG